MLLVALGSHKELVTTNSYHRINHLIRIHLIPLLEMNVSKYSIWVSFLRTGIGPELCPFKNKFGNLL